MRRPRQPVNGPARGNRSGPPGHAAIRPAVAVLGLLVFAWPLVRSPPLALAEAFVHLFAWWAALIVALAVLARSDGRERPPGAEDDGG